MLSNYGSGWFRIRRKLGVVNRILIRHWENVRVFCFTFITNEASLQTSVFCSHPKKVFPGRFFCSMKNKTKKLPIKLIDILHYNESGFCFCLLVSEKVFFSFFQKILFNILE